MHSVHYNNICVSFQMEESFEESYLFVSTKDDSTAKTRSSFVLHQRKATAH